MKEKLKECMGPNVPIQLLLFNWITIAGVASGLFSGAITACIGMPIATVMISLALTACFVLCFYLANWHDMLQQASIYLCVIVVWIAFPEMYLMGGRIYSGMAVWFVVGIMMLFFLLRGKILYIFLTVTVALYSLILLFSGLGILEQEPIPESVFCFDVWQSVIFVGICAGAVVKFQIGVYEKELEKNEEQRVRMEVLKVEAEKANMAKSDFLANMSHEIRTPLNAIMGLTRIALYEDMPDSVRGNLEDILNSGNNLLAIINDILDFSKIESGKLEIVHTKYQLSSVIYDVSTIIHFRINDKPIEFIQEIDDTIPNTLYGDEVRIRQILSNILGNAAKYTKKGQIVLKMDWKRLGGIAILNIAVSDTGQGIRPENLEQIFKRFKRVELQDNRQIEGTGLGLSITKGLLDRMGGTISVESTYGKGSTFTVTIPQKIIDEKPLYGEMKKQAGGGHEKKKYFDSGLIFPGAKVLVVDDSVMNLKVAKGLLAPYKMDVECVGGARECLEAVAKTKYDLILLDHMMPEMDGVETLWRMREDPEFDTPVIALTANAVNGAKKMYLDWGFMDYISKPMHIEDLEACLKKYLASYMQRVPPGEQRMSSAGRQDKSGGSAAGAEASAAGRFAAGAPDMTAGGYVAQETAEPEEAGAEASAAGGFAAGAPDMAAGGYVTQEAVGAADAGTSPDMPETGGAEDKLPPDKAVFDIDQGMEYAVDDQDFYLETLHIYMDETAESEMLLRVYLEEENMKEYEVLVHALKSNSRMVGAVAVSELALELENQSRDGNLEFVQAHHEELMERLRLAKRHIAQYLKENE